MAENRQNGPPPGPHPDMRGGSGPCVDGGAGGDSADAIVDALRLRLADLRDGRDARVSAIASECEKVLAEIRDALAAIAAD